MKIIHVSDLHIDSKIEYLQNDKNKIMREEQIAVFEKLIDYAKVNGVKVIIIAGDMFDKSNVARTTKERILHDIKNCADIDFLYLSGNHDEDLLFNDFDLPKNLKFFGDNWTAFEYGNVVISGVKLAPSNASFIYDTLTLSSDKVNIVTLHGQVAHYKTKGDAEEISIPKLKNKNIDYLALGHIHSYSIENLDLRGKYCYSGCIKGRGFDEIGDKGFVLLEIEDNKVMSKFVRLANRNFYEHNFDISTFSSFYDAIVKVMEELEDNYNISSLIKLNLIGSHKEDFIIDTFSLQEKLNGKFFFVKVVDKTTLKIDKEDFENEKSLKGEFIRSVLGDEKLTDEEKNKIILLGLKALKGEGV